MCHRLRTRGALPYYPGVAINYRFLSTATKRWAFPIAIVLLPGGFVLLAFAWCYKAVLPKRRRAADVKAAEPVVAARGNLIAVMRMYSEQARYELNCARQRRNALREAAAAHPAPAVAAAEPPQQAIIP